MHLRVGIVGDSNGWQQILRQEGVPFSQIGEEISADQFSVIAIAESIDEREAEAVKKYLREGGAILCSAQVYAQLAGTNYAHFYVRYLYSEQDSQFEGVGLIDVHQKCRVALNANSLRNEKGATMLYCGEFLGGHVIALPFDVDDLFLDHRAMAKSFYSTARRMPYERVSMVARGAVRKLLSKSLEILHHRRSLPYAHLWYYPRDDESAFLFRVDTDKATEADIDNLYELALKHRVPMTWFIDAKCQEDGMGVFKRMQNQELGLHCYDHRVFKNFELNKRNLEKGVGVLRASGIEAKGFAAPFGRWNRSLAQAVRELGFDYSSEFSYDYDNLPSNPVFDEGVSEVWQVPVHPICVGSLKRQGYNDAKMIQYFEFVMRHRLASREPIGLYHHPKDGNHRVLEHIFNFVDSHRIRSMKFKDFLEWWKKRTLLVPALSVDGTTLHMKGTLKDEEIHVRISKGDGTEAFVPLRPDIHLEGLDWGPVPRPSPLPADFLRCRKFNYRIPLTRAVDILSG
jgi:peptidoglycan/xylan/chitin deacetylase (PgdA/CDA1 family)